MISGVTPINNFHNSDFTGSRLETELNVEVIFEGEPYDQYLQNGGRGSAIEKREFAL